MFNKKYIIIPKIGLNSICLYDNIDKIINILKNYQVDYNIEIWKLENIEDTNPWKVINISNDILLFFAANDKLFKIHCKNNFSGSLSNGIMIGMPLEQAMNIDPSLYYEDDFEQYVSKDGYWIEDDIDTRRIISITIFIKEIDNDDLFDSCKW